MEGREGEGREDGREGAREEEGREGGSTREGECADQNDGKQCPRV